MRTILKGSPQWSIDTNGVITIITTWMCLADEGTENVLTGWLNFQNEVDAFAGRPGDAYKKPKQSASDTASIEVTEYEESELFRVQDVTYQAVDGRTYYEVTFTNLQNFDKLTLIGGINASVNENNERTKTAEYRASIDNPQTIDGQPVMDELLLTSGTQVTWAGDSYLIESTEYTAESPVQYIISITAKDMSRMMIGLPQEQTDSFGNKTITVTWRFSREGYDSADLPQQGDDASSWIGNRDGFIVQSIDAHPYGVLGYNVTIQAVSNRLATRISSTRNLVLDENTGVYYTEWESTFQTDEPRVLSLEEGSVKNLIPEGTHFEGTIRDVTYTERITGAYDVRVRMSDKGVSRADAPEETWTAEVTQEKFRLTPIQAGYAKTPSGYLYQINFPPTTTFTYIISPKQLVEMRVMTGNSTPEVTESKLLSLIKSKGTIGYDRIVGVQGFIKNKLKWLSTNELKALSNFNDVQSILLEGFVYAQPTMTSTSGSIRNMLFEPWTLKDNCPFWWDDWKQTDGRDHAIGKWFKDYDIKYHNVSVSMLYKVPVAVALTHSSRTYYEKAISKIKCSNYTSYKGQGISYTAVRQADLYGTLTDYTRVTCKIFALSSSNKYSLQWNRHYDRSIVI